MLTIIQSVNNDLFDLVLPLRCLHTVLLLSNVLDRISNTIVNRSDNIAHLFLGPDSFLKPDVFIPNSLLLATSHSSLTALSETALR